MRKTLLISFEYPTDKAYCGGVGQIVKQSRIALRELGQEVYVLISPGFKKKSPVKLLLPDDRLVRFRNFHSFQKNYDWRKFNYIVQHFVNWTRELKKLKNSKSPRPRIIYHFHSILRREKESGFKTLNNFLLNQERMIEIADKVICPSRYEYDNFIKYFPYFSDKATLIENTIESFPRKKKEVEKLKGEYRIKNGDVITIYVGRLEKIKGADVLIKYLPRALARHKKLKVFIIGKTLEKGLSRKLRRVQGRFPRQLIYIKYVRKDKLFQYYYLSDIYINPSLSESFSLSTHESALCRTTLLLNSLPVFDKFKDAASFFSIHETNGMSFMSQYENLIRHKKLRKRLASKSARIAKDFLTRNRLKEDLLKFLKLQRNRLTYRL